MAEPRDQGRTAPQGGATQQTRPADQPGGAQPADANKKPAKDDPSLAPESGDRKATG